MGSLAAGSAAAVGTGAFTSVSATRTVTVTTVADANALLGLTPSSSPNAEYAEVTGSDEITIDLDNGDDGGGAGLNKNAETTIGRIVEVTNQGTQNVQVYVPPDSVSDRVTPDPDGDGDKEFAKQGNNGDTDDGYPNDIYLDVVTPRGGKSLTGIYGVFSPSDSYFDDMVIAPGSSLLLGLFIRTKNPPSSLDVSFDIAADADLA